MAHATTRSKGDDDKAVDVDDEPMEPAGVPPPDGGWGWVIVFASFMIHIVTDGVTYSFGVIHLKLVKYFDEGNGATAWIASILVGVTLCSGPVSSSFVNKYGCRAVTIFGSLLASACLFASFFAQNVLTLCITIGLGTGLGFGMIYLPAIVSVTCYFEKYRSLATGIAVCGSGLGTLIFAPLIQYLIDEYEWRGTMIILSGLVLNCMIFGGLFRPLEPKKKEEIPLKDLSIKKEVVVKLSTPNGLIKSDIERPHSVSNMSNAKYLSVSTQDDKTNNMRVALSQPILITRTNPGESVARAFGSGVMHRRDIFYQGSLENVRRRSGSLGNSEENVRYHSIRSLPNGTGKQADNFDCLPYAEDTLDILHEMLELSLLKDPVFLLFTLSNFCTSVGFNIPYVYLVAQAEKQGIVRKSASYLLSIIGISNTAGRIVLGYVSDKPWINRLLVYNLCLTICGVSTALSAFCTSYTALSFYSTVFGFTAGAYVGLTSVILVDLLGLDRLTNAFGLLLLFQGIASLLGPPLAGWLYDAFQTYDYAFYLAGGMITVSGLMLFYIPTIQKNIQRKQDRLRRINIASVT